MQFTAIASTLMALAALSSAAAITNPDGATPANIAKRHDQPLSDSQVAAAWSDGNMQYHPDGKCTWDGKCELPGLGPFGISYYAACASGSCSGNTGHRCFTTMDDSTRCPGFPAGYPKTNIMAPW